MKESVLRRWASRAEMPRVRFDGMRVHVSIDLRWEGETERVEALGRREFGGWVRFTAPGPEHAAAGRPRFLAKSAERMVEAFAGLCLCARPRECCDCCLVCEGEGKLEGHDCAEACDACCGRGYGEESSLLY